MLCLACEAVTGTASGVSTSPQPSRQAQAIHVEALLYLLWLTWRLATLVGGSSGACHQAILVPVSPLQTMRRCSLTAEL